MIDWVQQWVQIPTSSYDTDGLAKMADSVEQAFLPLNATVERIDLQPNQIINSLGMVEKKSLGQALRFRKRPEAPKKIFLGIHTDVVYGKAPVRDELLVTAKLPIIDGKLYASGAADAKGGLAILIMALEVLEASPYAKDIGWEVLINPDEELGSPGSLPLLIEAAGRNHIGLLFEPALSNGDLVGARKGSGNFTLVVHGKAAHAGRDAHLGRNAIHALARFIVDLEKFAQAHPDILINVGKIEGGGPVNRIPDLAIGRLNIRIVDAAQLKAVENYLQELQQEISATYGVTLELYGEFRSLPKPLSDAQVSLLNSIKSCGEKLGMQLDWQSSGGVSDGNKLAAAGLVNVDTLGAVGGNIHSSEEYLIVKSLEERASLVALLLMQIGSGEITLPLK